ncbi:MAG: glycosyltransferase family 39 protein, partial [Patescibacteria group bacterium]
SEHAPFEPNAAWPPVFPFLLGMLGSSRLWVYLIFQILIASASVAVLYKIGFLVFSRRTALLAGLVFALDPISAFWSINLLSETLFTFLFLLSLYFLIKFWKEGSNGVVFFSALFLGLATLTRVVTSLFPAIILVFCLFAAGMPGKRKLAAILIFAAVFIATLSPWLARNQRVFESFSLSYIPTYNWYWYNARQFYAYKNHLSQSEAKTIFLQWREEAVADNPKLDNHLKLQPFYAQKAFQIIAQDPAGYLRLHLTNTAAVFLSTGWDDMALAWTGRDSDVNLTGVLQGGGIGQLFIKHPGLALEKVMLLIFYLAILLGAILSLKLKRAPFYPVRECPATGRGAHFPHTNMGFNAPHKFSNGVYFLFFLAIFAFFGLSVGAGASARFRLPVQPLLILVFIESIFMLRDFFKSRNQTAQIAE